MRRPLENAWPKRRTSVLLLLAVMAGGIARADEPVTLAGGRIRLGGEASGTFSGPDAGYFNYTDYGHSNLRLFRLNLDVEARAGDHVALVGQLRSDNLDVPRPYALYLRVRPWTARAFDIQAGRIPPVFGSYPRRGYALDNPLPGMPLAYQYLTTLRPDALPYSADDLYGQQGSGWLVRGYPIGAPQPAPGMPLVNSERWDTGVQVKIGGEPLELAAAVTQGTLSHPLVRDDNHGKQVSARLAWRPAMGLVLGASGARGDYLSHQAADALPGSYHGAHRQTAAGLDAEFSAGYWILRAEAVWSGWEIPPLAGASVDRLEALGLMLEARYKVAPGFYLAGRADHLGFSRIESGATGFRWDAPVTRVEIGAGYSPSRHLLLKASVQHNRRDGGNIRGRDFLAGQVVLWF
jgi:hypothetical protein